MHENPWHVLHIIANHEKRVAQHLAVRSVEHYLPLYAERSRWTDRMVTVERPLFPGYVFVRFSAEARVSVISTPGVLRMLGCHQRDTVSEAELARIREGLVKGCHMRPHSCVPVGSTVRVLRGVFEGCEGVVTEFRRQCQVVMSLSCTGRCFSLEVDVADIEVLRTHDDRRAPLKFAVAVPSR
jgi:transcription antitermination factor NusG